MELRRACEEGNLTAVRQLCEAGADYDMQDEAGATPLMLGALMGHSHVLLELIRAGATVTAITSRELWSVAAGSTALHFAAASDNIECGVLLVEAGADMRTRNKNSKSPLDLASSCFRRTIQQAQSFSTKRIVAVIGNGEHGKSTLIAALQAEGNSLLKKLTNRFTKVQDIRKRTAGIEVVQFSSQKYGDTLFYDFAGQSDYHGPHQSFLEAMLSRPGVPVSLLLLVKSTDVEDIITRQVTHWLQPLSLTSAPSTPQVILVGSFLDQVESREKATEKLLRCTQSLQEQFHFNIQGPCLLDCRKPASEGIDQICTFLQENEPLQLNCKTFSYSLRWVLVQVRKEFSVPAVTLHTFQSWLLNDAKLNPQYFPPAKQICHDLTSVGHTLFLPNKQDPSQSWLILDLQAILHDVYGTLFSESQGKVNQFGLLHCSQLTELFPELDSAMIQEVLVSLEFCIQVDSSLLREELLKLTARDEGDSWLYFPALVSAQPLEVFSNVPDPHHLQWACWQLRTAERHFISAHLLQAIILRLAANHAFTHKLSPSVREYCCSVWVNGLSWMSTKDVDVAVQISDSSVVQVVGRSKAGPEKLHQYMSTIVSDVIKTTAQLSPKLEATSYIVRPYTPAMWKGAKAPPPDSLYPVSSIIHSISDEEDHVLSCTRPGGHLPHKTSLTELFGGWSPLLSVVQDMDFKTEPWRAGLSVPSAPSSLHEFESSYLHEFKERYSEVVRSQASVTLKITKCTTIGPPRVGKTCFKNLFTGQQWDVEAGTPSTDVMKAPEWVECYSLEEEQTEELWKLVSREQQQGTLLRAVNQLTTKYSDTSPKTPAKPRGDSSPETTAKPRGDAPLSATATPSGASPTATSKPSGDPPTAMPKPSGAPPTATPKPSGDPPTITHTHAATASSAAKVPATVWQALKALSCACSKEELEHLLKDKKGKVLGETRLIHFIDTGGQAIYHDVHPVLITSPSVYLVVFSLKELYLKSDKEQLDYFRSDLIQRPLRSIYTFGMKNSLEEHLQFRPETPTIFIIGTHLDHISRESDCEKILATLDSLISTEIANKPYRDLVQYDPEGRSFWAVDNTLAGREKEKGVKTCMSTLRKLVQDSSMEISVKVPLPWMLLKLVMDSKGVLCCKYSDLLKEALIRGYVREDSAAADLDSMLRLFHILGLIYHKVPSECKKENSLVFIDPNCLYSATSDLLMAAKEEVESSSKGQYQSQTGTTGEIEEHQHRSQAVTEKESKELVGMSDRQQMLESGRIVVMERVLQRMQDNMEIIEQEMEAVLQDVQGTMARLGQKPTEVVLELLRDKLKEMAQKFECQGAMSVEEKRQLFIGGLVNGLASFVKALLCDSIRKSKVHHVREDLNKAVRGMKKQCISRSIHKDDTDQFLSLLSDLRIVAHTKDMDRYVIPAALPRVPWSETFAGSAEPILVTVESKSIMSACYLPSGLFCCLISELVTGLGWTVIPLGRTHVAFTHVDVPGKVHVMENESYIEINLESEASQQELALACQTVRRSIHEGLVRVYIDLFSDSTAGPTLEESLIWGFLCKRGSSDEVHIAAFHEDGGYWKECTCCHLMEEVTPAQMLWASSGLSPSQLSGDVDFRLTKCITIRIQDVGAQTQLKPVQNWVQYMQYVTPEQVRCLIMSKKSDWKFANNSDILLCINLPNHQVYPLPLLVTPVTSVYVVAFDLPEEEEKEKKVLKEIHNTLKELYTCSSHEDPDEGLNEELCITPKVLLVGLQKEITERSDFAQQLSHMLKMRSYESLLIFPEGGDPYWSNPGADLSVNCNAALLSTIQRYCCQPTRFIRQALVCHCEMLQKFDGSLYVSFEDVEAKMADVVSGITEDSNVEQFLKVLHCVGLIFYRSLPNLKQSENIVVLQPQYLYQLFEKAQELGKQRDAMTIAELLMTSQMPERVWKWFQAVCISMGLVIEEWCGNQADYIYVMGLNSKCDTPSHAYCVDPLLVSYRSQQFVQRQRDCFLPSFLFPAFVSNFLKELKLYVMEQNQGTRLKDCCSIVRKRHHWCVRIHVSEQPATQIHIVEQDSFIEIGLLQFDIRTFDQTREEQKEKLQHFCQDIRTVVSKSAENAAVHLRLNKPSIHYGFHVCHSESGKAVNCFGEFHPEDNTLVCFCDPPVRQEASVQQQIWFSGVELTEHVLRPVLLHGPTPIRKLEPRDFPDPRDATVDSSDLPSDSKTETQDPTKDIPPLSDTQIGECASSTKDIPPLSDTQIVEKVLKDFVQSFTECINVNAIKYELKRKDIISDAEVKRISDTASPKEQRQLLHDHLQRTCTVAALIDVCNIISAVKGNRRMKELGEDMKKQLMGEASMTHRRVHGNLLGLRDDSGYGGSSTASADSGYRGSSTASFDMGYGGLSTESIYLGYGSSSTAATSTHSTSHLVEHYQKMSMPPLAEGPSLSHTSSEEDEEETKHQGSKVPSEPAGEGSGPPREPDSAAVMGAETALVDLCWISFGIQSQSVRPEGGKLSLEPSAGAMGGGGGGTILLEVPPGAVSPVESVEVRSALIPDGPFTLPEGYQLGSMVVYLYYDGRRLTKPCTLSLPHWYGGEDQVRDGLSFAMAPHTLKEGERVYHFELLEGGRFAEQQQCGVLEITGHCTLFAAVFKVKASSLYYASLWTHQVGGAVVANNAMESKVVITYADQVWIEVLEEYWREWKMNKAKFGGLVKFRFSDNKEVLGMLSSQCGEGWKVSLEADRVCNKDVAYPCRKQRDKKNLEWEVHRQAYPPAFSFVVRYNSLPDCSKVATMEELIVEGTSKGRVAFPFEIYQMKTPHPPTSPSTSPSSSMGGCPSLPSPVDTGGEDISHTGASTVDSGRDPVLSQKVSDHPDHLILFRKYVSRKAATKGRAVLEGVGLDSCTIQASFNSASEEAAVQDGLIKWKDGQGRQPPTWEVLISAMEYAEVAQHHIEDLRMKLCA